MLYDKDDFALAKKRAAAARVALLLGVLLVMAAGIIPMLINRSMLLSVILSAAAAMLCVFFYGTLLAPTLAYRRFMLQAEEGIRHTFIGEFLEYADESVRDNVRFIAVRFQEEKDAEPRLCYVDSSVEGAGMTGGGLYSVTHTGNLVIGIEKAVGNASNG